MGNKQSLLNICLFYSIIILQFSFGSNDFESRNAITFQLKLPHSFKIEFKQGLWLSGQELSFKQTFTEFDLSYKINNRFNIFIPFRYAIFEDEIKKRLSFGGSYKYNLKTLSFRYKSRFQRVYEQDNKLEETFRNKFSVINKLKKDFELFLSAELFNPHDQNDDNKINEYRISFGANTGFSNNQSIKTYYTFKAEDINKTNPEITNIIGLSYNFN